MVDLFSADEKRCKEQLPILDGDKMRHILTHASNPRQVPFSQSINWAHVRGLPTSSKVLEVRVRVLVCVCA